MMLTVRRQLGCAGALLGYITRQRTEAGECENDLFEVSGLELMRLYTIACTRRSKQRS